MSPAAERQRRRRARQRSGRRVFRVEVDVVALEVALQAHEYLSPMTDDPQQVERALRAMVEQFCSVTRDSIGE
jgi:hypothetical protein